MSRTATRESRENIFENTNMSSDNLIQNDEDRMICEFPSSYRKRESAPEVYISIDVVSAPSIRSNERQIFRNENSMPNYSFTTLHRRIVSLSLAKRIALDIMKEAETARRELMEEETEMTYECE